MDTVLYIPELVRYIVSQGSSSVMIFFANKKTLEQEPCASAYRTWARQGVQMSMRAFLELVG